MLKPEEIFPGAVFTDADKSNLWVITAVNSDGTLDCVFLSPPGDSDRAGSLVLNGISVGNAIPEYLFDIKDLAGHILKRL